jgi:predicted transcriptional regulator
MSEEKDFFSNGDMFKVSKKTNPAEVLEFIKSNTPISVWDICKKLNLNRNTAYYLLRDLEFAGLISSKLKVNEHNRKVRIVYYKKGGGGNGQD